jgi:hypothetical protein
MLEDPKGTKKRGNPLQPTSIADGGNQAHTAGSTGAQDEEDLTSEVRILDLHTENPLVSYCGQLFSCQWAENIGTEFFFMKNDRRETSIKERVSLMQGGVNLLGTSSVRLVSTPLKAELKSETASGQNNAKCSTTTGSSIKAKDLFIDVGSRPSARRLQQAKFLQDLIQVKEKRGEEDLVTVHIEKRYTNLKWKKEMVRQRMIQRNELQSALKDGDEKAREEARKGLEILDEEERLVPLGGEETKPSSGQPPKKRPRVDQQYQRTRESSVAIVGEQNRGSTPSSRTSTPHLQPRSRSSTPATGVRIRSFATRPIAPRPIAPQPIAPRPPVLPSVTTQSTTSDAVYGAGTEGYEAKVHENVDPSENGAPNMATQDTAIGS